MINDLAVKLPLLTILLWKKCVDLKENTYVLSIELRFYFKGSLVFWGYAICIVDRMAISVGTLQYTDEEIIKREPSQLSRSLKELRGRRDC